MQCLSKDTQGFGFYPYTIQLYKYISVLRIQSKQTFAFIIIIGKSIQTQ